MIPIIISKNNLPLNYLLITLPHPKYGPIHFIKSINNTTTTTNITQNETLNSLTSTSSSLPSPNTPNTTPTTISNPSHTLYELQSIKIRKYGSWFIDQRIFSSSEYYILSKFDYKYLLLPYFEKNSANYSPLDQIVVYETDNGCDRIELDNYKHWNLNEICDINNKLGENRLLYRLNLEKVISWLRDKVTRLSILLYQQRMKLQSEESKSIFDSSFQSGLNNNSNNNNNNNTNSQESNNNNGTTTPSEQDTKAALNVIIDYLTESMTTKLLQSYELTIDSLSTSSQFNSSQKRKSDWENSLEVILFFKHFCNFLNKLLFFNYYFHHRLKKKHSLLQQLD